MNILFVQLPLQDHSYGYINGNIDYAPAALSGYILKRFKHVQCQSLPFVQANFASNERIVSYILKTQPDLLSFTCYLWNVERNLEIAKIIKERDRKIKIIFGGPEIATGSYAIAEKREAVDIFVSGEGEWFYNLYLSGVDIDYKNINGNRVAFQPHDELIPICDIFEPLAGNRLNSMIDGSVFMELTRGCPYRCSYCYYSRNYNKVREIPFEKLIDVIKGRRDIKEIYILSPTFDRSPDFIQKLENLKSLRHSVRLHTEMRTDRITRDIAKLIFDAGFKSLEVGLQSMNKRALSSVNRSSNPQDEIKGMSYLRDAGIDLKIGIIPGLPGDDPENFKNTIDTLVAEGFDNSIELYPLMILPGTEIRSLAQRDDIAYQTKPPYFFLQGWNFSIRDISDLSLYLEEKTGMSSSLFYLPDFTDSQNPFFIKGFSLSSSNWALITENLSEADTAVVDIHISAPDESRFYEELEKFVVKCDTNRLYNIIIYSDIVFESQLIYRIISENERDHYYRRINLFNGFFDGSIFHFFQVTSNIDVYDRILSETAMITPIFFLHKESIPSLPKKGGDDLSLLIDEGCYDSVKGFLKRYYKDIPSSVAFKNEAEMSQFYSEIKAEFLRYPFSFGIKRI